MAIEYNFTLDMDRSKRDNNIAYARTGDIDSIVINADLVFGGAAYTPSGTNAFFECITPNGRSIRAAAEKTGSSVSVEVPPAAFQAAGVINVAYFRFETGASDNPTYVESTEPFAIVVREGIGDSIDAGDYIEEWRKLADQLEAAVAEVKKKAEQAETAIDEQKTEVDQLKAQAQKAIAGDVTEVEGVAQSAIAAINKEKADVADAAEDISAAGEQAINSFNSKGTSAINKFNTNSQQAIGKFNTDSASAISKFNTNAGSKLDEVDGMITEAQGDVDAAVTQLETATDKAVSAMEDALDGTTAGSLQNAINRTLKLDVADMTNIPDNSSLSSFTNVGSYCCKTAATAATVGDCPIDDSPFNMYVFSSAVSGQVMQLVVPIDLNGKPTAEWHVRFGTSSAMDKWSVIGGGADIAAGLGIDVTGDAQKTVALDTTAFYQHHEAASIIRGSSEVTGGGRIKKLTVYGNTKQNLWVNPSGTSNGITVTSNEDGSITLSGTSTGPVSSDVQAYVLKPNTQYTVSTDKAITGSTTSDISFFVGNGSKNTHFGYAGATTVTFTTGELNSAGAFVCGFYIRSSAVGATVSGTYRVMLREATKDEIAAAQPFDWVKPGINGAEPDAIIAGGNNIISEPSGVTNHFGAESTYSDGVLTITNIPTPRLSIVRINGVLDFVGDELDEIVFSFDCNAKSDVAITFDAKDGNQIAIRIKAGTSRYSVNLKVGLYSSFIDIITGQNWPEGNTIVISNMQVGLPGSKVEYEIPSAVSMPLDLKGHQIHMMPDGTRDELRIDGTGAVTLVQRVGVVTLTGEEAWKELEGNRYGAGGVLPGAKGDSSEFVHGLCDKLYMHAARGSSKKSNWIVGYTGGFVNAFMMPSAATLDDFKNLLKTLKPKVYYPMSKEKEIPLGSIAMPALHSPNYAVYVSSDVPAEIEAEVVKVDYLPAPDVYTKQEVDQKIEDAGMPAVVPVSKGGTGVTTAAAERNRLGLGNTTGALPVANGGTGITTAAAERNRLGLGNTTGALPVANGGTGATTAKASQNALLGIMEDVDTVPEDNSSIVFRYASPNATQGAVFSRKASFVWSYIASKIRSTFGFSSSNVLPVANGGTGLTKAPSMLVNLESASAANPLASDPRPGVSGELPLTRGGTGGTSAAAARTNLGVYSKAEVDGKVPKVVYGTGNIPSNAENGTIYIQYRS